MFSLAMDSLIHKVGLLLFTLNSTDSDSDYLKGYHPSYGDLICKSNRQNLL